MTVVEDRGAACVLCGATRRRQVYEIAGYAIVRCLGCNLVFTDTTLSRSDSAAYYSESYFAGGTAQGYADYDGQGHRRRAHYRSLIPLLHRYLGPKQPRVLDIGCATGLFLEVARADGWQTWGVELSSWAAKRAQSKGLTVHEGTLEEASYPDSFFTVVTMWDVIEHLADPVKTLAEVHRIMSPGGLLVLLGLLIRRKCGGTGPVTSALAPASAS